ncbi:MAG: DUF4041 domain-containing protein [Clostridiales bacterium]|nr:DUF4041 domain-containing protein [Clostridiales bacterium]
MGVLDVLNVNKYKETIQRQEEQINLLNKEHLAEIDKLTANYNLIVEQKTAEINKLNKILIPELLDIDKARNELANLTKQLEEKSRTLRTYEAEISRKSKDLIILNDELLFQQLDLYEPIYDFAKSGDYKAKLENIRQQQKIMIKENTAAVGGTGWKVNNSLKQGEKMVKDNIKQIIRTFNNECEVLIDKVKYNNIDSFEKRIVKSYEDLNKLNSAMNIRINPAYLELKLQELHLAHEYACKKQEEKELEKERRAEMREAAKLERELVEERKKIEKEQHHYQKALDSILVKMRTASEDDKAELVAKKEELEKHLEGVEQSIVNLDYRENNQKAGYVYVISNIGAFGKDVYKIGMTRRLDPMERVYELGDASVPFNFDVHAMIFSDDAPALEAALHRAFENKKVNMINTRREFFNVTLEEIEEVVKAHFDKTVDFVKEPPAEQYRESLLLKKRCETI